jgi:hypothetical protein
MTKTGEPRTEDEQLPFQFVAGGSLAGRRINSSLFGCFFLRCAGSPRIVLAVRGPYSLRLADAPAAFHSEEENETRWQNQ